MKFNTYIKGTFITCSIQHWFMLWFPAWLGGGGGDMVFAPDQIICFLPTRKHSFFSLWSKTNIFFLDMFKDPFNCVAYRIQADALISATKLITRYYSNETLPQCCFKFDQRLRHWPNIEPTLAECTMFEEKLSCQYTFWGSAVSQSPQY